MLSDLFDPTHIIVLVIVAALLFYKGDKLPDAARSVGRSLRVFKTEIKGLAEDDKAREDARNDVQADSHTDPSSTGVGMTKSEPPHAAIEAPVVPVTPRVVAEPSAAIPVRAEVVREPAVVGTDSRPRPRPRPAGSSSTR